MCHKQLSVLASRWGIFLSLCFFCGCIHSADFPKSLINSISKGVVDSSRVDPVIGPGLSSAVQRPFQTFDPYHRSSLFRDLKLDFGNLARDPLFIAMLMSMTAVPSMLTHEDPEINEDWAHSRTADNVFKFGNVMGNGMLPISVSGLALAVGKLAHQPEVSDFGSDLLRAQALTGLTTLSMKVLTGRKRPDGTPWSFPSGHTSVTFATAAVIYGHYGWKYGTPAFMAATYVGLSRLQANKHYPSDVIAGAFLGGYIGFKVADRKETDLSLRFTPMATDGYGISASLRF